MGGRPGQCALQHHEAATVRGEFLQRPGQPLREAGIPLQVGLTQGGTDGTAFTYLGAPNVPLSWTGRYSHSPAEVLDLRDVQRLGQLIAAIVRQ